MLTIVQILAANFANLDNAAEKWEDVAKRLTARRDDYDFKVLKAIGPPVWDGEAAATASIRLGEAKAQFDLGINQANAFARALRDAAAEFRTAQSTLSCVIADAQERGFDINYETQTVTYPTQPDDAANAVRHKEATTIAANIATAIAAATQADERAANDLNRDTGSLRTTFNAEATVGRGQGPQDPVSILQRLLAYDKDRLNLPPDLIAYAKEAAHRYGISEELMLITLVQEQQWYQRFDPGLDSPLTKISRFGEWVGREIVKPDKSLSFTHMKVDTAREVADKYKIQLDDGRRLADLDDTEIAAAIEQNSKLAIDLSAMHLASLRREPGDSQNRHGADTDYGVFLLYSADTQQVRNYNEWLGDDPEPRSGSIHDRAVDYKVIEQHLLDTQAWEALTPAQREAALQVVGATMPHGTESKPFTLYPTTPGVQTTVTSTQPWDGTGEMPHADELPPAPPPPTPTPQPNKQPAPPS